MILKIIIISMRELIARDIINDLVFCGIWNVNVYFEKERERKRDIL